MDFTPVKNFMDRLTSWIIPGNSICVYYQNEEVFRYSSGYSKIETFEPMSDELYVNIYSCSKVATVVAALQLVERGYLHLSDPLYWYIPEYKDMYIKDEKGNLSKAKNTITIGHLFTMTAGLNYDSWSPDCAVKKTLKATDGRMETVEFAKQLASTGLEFEPGTKFRYSFCHDVLGAVVEIVSGKRFKDYVKENIFDPCGITKAHYHYTDEIKANMAGQYSYEEGEEIIDLVKAQNASRSQGKGKLKNVGFYDMRFGSMFDSGGAGIITTVREYALFANALANFGKSKLGEQILCKESVELLRTNQLGSAQLPSFQTQHFKGYGYGLGVRTLIDKAAAGSLGSIGEFGWGGAAGATVLVDPDRQFSYVYAHHMLNPQESYYQPRLRNVAYMSLDS